MRKSQFFLKCIASLLLLALPMSCAETARMQWLDKMMVKPDIQKLPSGGVQIIMAGDALLNPTAAVERFHQLAEKQLAGSAYRYDYRVEKADVLETFYRLETTKRQVPVTTSSTSSYRPSYVPLYGGGGGGGISGGDAAIILASAVVLSLLIKAVAKNRPAPAPATVPRMKTITETKTVKDQRVTGQVLKLTGTAHPIARLNWPKGSQVEVVIPSSPPIIGKMDAESARGFADATAAALKAQGYVPMVVASPTAGSRLVRPVILRAQGTFDAGGQQISVEYEFSEGGSRSHPTRVFVQTANPFGGQSPSIKLSQAFSYHPAAITNPLKKKLQTLLP